MTNKQTKPTPKVVKEILKRPCRCGAKAIGATELTPQYPILFPLAEGEALYFPTCAECFKKPMNATEMELEAAAYFKQLEVSGQKYIWVYEEKTDDRS